MSSCRSCGSGELRHILSLGTTPLANSLLTREQLQDEESRYPLDLAFCTSCSLAQIVESVPPDRMFSEYLYFSSFSDSMLASARELSARVIEQRSLGADDLVVELASNDGYLLQYYKQAGIGVLGIEPARNVARSAIVRRGIPTVVEFFGSQLAEELRKLDAVASVVHANNVLAHVPDLNGFVSGIERILASRNKGDATDGVAILEFPYARDFIERCEFDTIYHEHLSYFSLSAVRALFARQGLALVDVEKLPIHGGSLRIFACSGDHPESARVTELLRQETAIGLDRVEYFRDFAADVSRRKEELRALLSSLKSKGHTIAAYGAAAKGSTLLNYLGVGTETIDFVVDRSTYKQGRFMPGVHLPILAPEALIERQPDYTLLLTWNFADEILSQQAEYRARGGRFILPEPSLKVV